VAILQKGRIIMQGEVDHLLRQSERLLVRMNSSTEAQAALTCLCAARPNWLAQQQNESLEIAVSPAHASEIVALLAGQQLYLAEIRLQQNSLEEIFMDLVAPEESTANMSALVG
jgi:ABC-type uncharacterized transport system ATPase subunit